MANSLTCDRVPGIAAMRLNNSHTALLFEVLCLAACRLAKSDWEKRVAYFLVQHDQSRIGRGTVDVDIAQLGWTAAGFDAEKSHVLAIIDGALAKLGWERLGWQPELERIGPTLDRLRAMVAAFPASAIPSPEDYGWTADELPPDGECEVHGVYLHDLGCILCNAEPLSAPAEQTPHRS